MHKQNTWNTFRPSQQSHPLDRSLPKGPRSLLRPAEQLLHAFSNIDCPAWGARQRLTDVVKHQLGMILVGYSCVGDPILCMMILVLCIYDPVL